MDRKILTLALVLAALTATTPAQQRGLVAGQKQFLIDGKPIQVISGEMHYIRIPRDYWRDRLKKARAMGLNTISTYVFWNIHEMVPGRYDFAGQRDVATFVRTAGEEGLHVIVRPGPYVCAEWDLGGYPGWLFKEPDIVLRSTDEKFTRPAERWLERLGKELTPLLASRGGPIVAIQVENEYGSFGKDQEYMSWSRSALENAGFGEVMLFTADGPPQLADGTLLNLPAVVNFAPGGAKDAFARLEAFRPNGPLMTGEYWAGWFNQWGRAHQIRPVEPQVRELEWMLGQGYSVNLYMFHGGTTFGFMNGANIDGNRYYPQTSSYDYDSALDESGRPAPKFAMFRDLITKRTGVTPPPMPETPAPVTLPAITLGEAASIWTSLGSPQRTDRPRSMETFGQSYGYILYRTTLAAAAKGELIVKDVRDYAQVYLDGALVGTIDRRLAQDRLAIDSPKPGARLDILVENSGRVNFALPLRDERKGITKSVSIGELELTGWQVFTLPMTPQPSPKYRKEAPPDGPAFYRGTFTVTAPADTFLDTRGWGKGTLWINGYQLGRFWDIGPQQTLYVPGVWLRKGANEIVVFDLLTPSARTISGLAKPILDQLNTPPR